MQPTAILYALLGLSILSLLLTAILLLRGARQSAALSRPLQDELRATRLEQAALAKALREEVRGSQLAQFEAFSARVAASLEEIRANDSGSPLYLPIDAKFPQEDYHRLLDAADHADAEGFREATAALVRTVRGCAREMSEKYVHPPATTDFAIMFLPTEGLYAEVLRQPGLVQDLNRLYSVMVVGPTTLAAILSSLRMGFRTLAIQQRSSEVWRVLGAVKAEFAKFGSVLDKLKKQLNTATNTIDESGKRTRAMERRLREVEELPPDLAQEVVGLVDEPAALLDNGDDEEDAEAPDNGGPAEDR